MKEVITEALKNITVDHEPVPAKITFEGIEYQTDTFFAEVKNRTPIGERFLQQIHDKATEKIIQGLESFLTDNPDEPFCDVQRGKAPTRRETYLSITQKIEMRTDQGRSYLEVFFEGYIEQVFLSADKPYDPLDMDVASGKEDVDDDDLF